MAKNFTHVITFRVNNELNQRIRRAAAQDDRLPGAYLRRILDQAVPRVQVDADMREPLQRAR